MAGDEVGSDKLQGNLKFLNSFNSTTIKGRANVAKATYAAVGLAILYFSLKSRKK